MKPYVTLIDLVEIVSEFASSENELIATVIHLIKSGQVELCQTPLAIGPVPFHAFA